MRSDSVCDFVSVGDVSIKVIGAESDMPDCDIPVRHILEQIIAKLGIPPVFARNFVVEYGENERTAGGYSNKRACLLPHRA